MAWEEVWQNQISINKSVLEWGELVNEKLQSLSDKVVGNSIWIIIIIAWLSILTYKLFKKQQKTL